MVAAGLTWLKPPSVPIPDHIPLDASVLLFTFGVGATVALLCGLAPALRMTQPDLNRVLQAGRTTDDRRRAGHTRRVGGG